MVGVENEEDVERAGESRIGLVLELGHLVEHPEEVAGVLEIVVRVDVGLTHVVAVGEGSERRHLGDQADRLDRPVVGVVNLVGVGVEGRQRAHRAEQHPHRVGVVAEALDETLDVLMHERVCLDLIDPGGEFGLGRQLAMDQQVGNLEIGRVLGQLLDWVAPVLEHAQVTVEIGDRAAARSGVHKRRVVGEQAEILLVGLDLAQIERADRAIHDRDLVALAGPVVGHRQCLAAGRCCWHYGGV